MKSVIGELSLHFEGYGFVTQGKPGAPDIFVPARSIGDAMHGDTVEVSVRPSKRGLFEGEVLKVLERRLKQMVGRLELSGREWVVLSEDRRVHQSLRLLRPPKGAHPGDYVVARITQYPSGKRGLAGEMIEKLPTRGNLFSEVEYVIAKHQLPKVFPKGVEKEAETIQSRRDLGGEAEGRCDLREKKFVTIDGEDAKDFDDAVYAEKLSNANIRLWVAIADVSHYVRPGSQLDQEAYERGTSVYFPGRVLPMLPEPLSNDLCSLRPNEDRLAMVAELEINPERGIVSECFYSAIFQSQARLTYTLVKKILLDQEEEVRKEYHHFVPMLEILSETAKRLHQNREERGSLDFDLPEPEIVLDMTGGIEDIERASRHWGHQIIEELMIAANEAVARFLTRKRVGCLYRIHEGPNPEKMRHLYQILHRLGYRGRFHFPVSSKTLGKALNFFKGHSEERFVNSVLLRSLAQAVYSETNMGHFGLGSDCYCHFTSPIRRYPDLVVHRLLKRALQQGQQGLGSAPKILKETGEYSSRQERRAMEAEREMIALHQALFLRQKLGENFEGIISHVTKFGFFVELIDYFVEGLVPKESLPGDQYHYDEEHLCLRGKNRQKMFKIGNPVRIQVEDVKLSERRAFFKLLDPKERAQ